LNRTRNKHRISALCKCITEIERQLPNLVTAKAKPVTIIAFDVQCTTCLL
jgi:hypothetical protein